MYFNCILHISPTCFFKLQNGRGGRQQAEDEVDIRLLVHQSQAGCIIGKGGLKIKEMREV